MLSVYSVVSSYPELGRPDNVGVTPPLAPWHPQPAVVEPVLPPLYPNVVSETDKISKRTRITDIRCLEAIRPFAKILLFVLHPFMTILISSLINRELCSAKLFDLMAMKHHGQKGTGDCNIRFSEFFGPTLAR